MSFNIEQRQIEIPVNDDRQGQETAQSNPNSSPGSKPIDKNTSQISGATVLTGYPVDPKNDENNPRFKSRIDRINIFSRIFFIFVFPLLWRGWKRNRKQEPMKEEDFITFPYQRRAEVLENHFMENMRKQKKKNPNKPASTAWAVAWTVKWTFLRSVFVQTVFGFLRVFSAWVAKRIIEAYMDPRYATTHSYWWVAILAGVLLLAWVFEHHWNHIQTYLCAYVRSGIISMLYSKITKLSMYSIIKISPGKLVNIAANDVNVFEMFGVYFPAIISGWLIMIAAAALLWTYFGVCCLLGIGYMVTITPITATIAGFSTKPRQEKNMVTDERVRKTSEALEGIRLLKMYTWEIKFKEIISELRRKDVKLMRKVLYLGDVLARGLAWSSHYMGAFLMFMLYDVTGGTLHADEVFSAYFILGFIRFYFVYFVSNAFNFIAETRLLFKRLDVIMDFPEMETVVFEAPKDPQNAIEFDNYTAYWAMEHLVKETPNMKRSISATAFDPSKFDTSDLRPVLKDVNLKIKKGTINAVIGSVGASKTSFLLSFTGEIPKIDGALRYRGKVAYVEQEPTIFAGNFRESILFGNEYNEEFYKKVIKACNLESDLKLFPNGDMSIVGERGNNLSGGQKARLALARAVYANADIYLLDDPLSAVDAKVAKSIYTEAITGLLKDKTVILATHQVHFVRELKNIIAIEDGKVIGTGSFDELKQQGVDVNKIFSVERDENKHAENEIVNMQTKPEDRAAEAPTTQGDQQKKDEDHGETGEGPSTSSDVDPYAGKVNLKTYGRLFRQAGLIFMLGLVCIYILLQFGDVAFGRCLGAWTSGEFSLGTALGALGGIAGYMILIYQIKNMSFTFGFLNASRKYHKKMLNKIIRSPVVFFDLNPVGRILNRFSNDIGVLDKFVPHVGLDVFDILATVLSVFITLSIVDPVLIAPIAGALLIISILIFFYYPTIKQTKGYDLSTRGPLYALLSSSISGITIIRTYGQADHLKERFTKMLYTNTKGNINFILSSRILGFCVDLTYNLTAIGMLYITTARINPNDTTSSSGAIAAFTLALILSLTGIFQHGVRQFCQTNVLMSAAARVQAYCDLPSEAALTCEGDQALIEKKWPNSGDIDFNRVYMKYREDTPFVIQDLNLHADSGEKIGCVGRTGAGKSTIINLLFRLQEIDRSGDHAQGSFIKVDHTDTQPLGLHLLRGNISIIPQSPFIFTGTVRQNVDPIGEFTDEQIWDALEQVRLKGHVSRLVNKLDTNMSNVSAVFSVGQKQLVCLARALLKPRKILVLDEATANMDTETDTFIQNKIMEKFTDSTVFTIAHRLATIAHYDKVLVLDKGRKMEFDAPYKLLVKNEGDDSLTNPGGYFGSMVMNTGPKTAQRIVNISKKAFEKKQRGEGGMLERYEEEEQELGEER